MQFETKIIPVGNREANEIEHDLNLLNNQGWRVVLFMETRKLFVLERLSDFVPDPLHSAAREAVRRQQ
jgi:hypothetical protein